MSGDTLPKVIIGMSGGVDSSVAAFVLKEAGYDVEGLFMKNWEEDDGTEYCTARADLDDARKACNYLNIPLHEANFAAEYWDNVFTHFLQEYEAGRTPNPDILCNREIKFKVFKEYAELLGAAKIATGHYARLEVRNGKTCLLKGLDSSKDQSYFLHQVDGSQFDNCLFPLGHMNKKEVRALAKNNGLHNFDRKDSTGICFIGERRFADFLKTYIGTKPGPIRSTEGDELGTHQGLMFYTIGQRQGLGIGGIRDAEEKPWYVVEKNLENNVLLVAQGNNHPRLFANGLYLTDLHWIQDSPDLPLICQSKIRYRQADQSCRLERYGDRYKVTFDCPQRAVTPGQYACFYDNDLCLGGGIIESTIPAHD